MDSSRQILPAQASSPQTPSRVPLIQKIVSPLPQRPKQIRRKSSFILRVDSSEDCPSPHDSIYEAFRFSGPNSDDSGNRAEVWPTLDLQRASTLSLSQDQGVNENNRVGGTSTNQHTIDDIEFRYGHGTILETITERKSNNTMISLERPKSADNLTSVPFLGHRDSFILVNSPRRKTSFSVDDLDLTKTSYHEACAIIERTAQKTIPVHEIYAQPRTPILAPPERPPTPDGMPSWTASQDLPPRARSRHSSKTQGHLLQRVQRFFSHPANEITFSSRIPLSRVDSRVRTVSAPVRGRIAPRFRPPRSAYSHIDQHPFHNSPVAEAITRRSPTTSSTQPISNLPSRTGRRRLGQRVRFTPSATARDSEMMSLRNAIESSSASALHPMSLMQSTPTAFDASPSSRECPHRRGRHAALEATYQTLQHQRSAPPSNEYTVMPSDSLSRRKSAAPAAAPILSLHTPAHTNSTIVPRVESIISNAQGSINYTPTRMISTSSTAPLISSAHAEESSTFPSSATSLTASMSLPTHHNINAEVSQQNKKEHWCWKCQLIRLSSKLDHCWTNTAGCMCFVCCGVDIEEDLDLGCSRGRDASALSPYSEAFRRDMRGSQSSGTVHPRRAAIGNPARQEIFCPPRRVVIQNVQAVGI